MAYLYFAQDQDFDTLDAVEGKVGLDSSGVFSSEMFLSTDVTGAAETTIFFKSLQGDDDGDRVVINHVEGKHKELLKCLADALNYQGPDMYVFFDEANQVFDKQLIDLGVVIPGTSTCIIED